MSFVIDQVHRIDAHLDRLQLSLESNDSRPTPSGPLSPAVNAVDQSSSHSQQRTQIPSTRVLALQAAVRSLAISGTSHNRSLQSSVQIRAALSALSPSAGPRFADATTTTTVEQKEQYEEDLEWLLVSKATTQVYGAVLKRILDQAVDIGADIWYWDEVLSSRLGTLFYSAQISPWSFWRWGVSVWGDVQVRAGDGLDLHSIGQDAGDSLSRRWKQFYGLVRDVVRERSVVELHQRILSPVTRIRSEIRTKQAALRKIRARNANALGVLLGEGLVNECGHGDAGTMSPAFNSAMNMQDLHAKWKTSVGRNVALMEAVLAKTTDLKTPIEKFDGMVAELTDDDPLYAVETHDSSVTPHDVGERLNRLLTLGLPQYIVSTRALVKEHGKPSRWVRYWLPITIGIFSSSTVLRMLVNRQAQLLDWARDLGATVVDFWTNWVLEPTDKLIKTIRHDEGSEISIMSKRSLQGDRDSLERMVVDFAIDNPSNATGSGAKLTDVEIADIRSKVAEGDLTPVLRAYEKDLTSPLMGAIRGNLIRALLIQIQKTKVDVELAMQGIDTLLKSQELLIGFISLTPGVLVAYGIVHYLRNTLFTSASNRRLAAAKKQGVMVRQLRNIDRILTRAQPTEFGELLYKDQGLLICEVHVLRQAASRLLPGEILREFGEEAEELCDVRVGIKRQRMVEERVRWAYARWMA